MAAASFALVLSLPVSFARLLCPTSQPEGGKRTGKRTRTWTRRAGWQTVEALPCCLLAAGRWRCVDEVWRRHRPEADEVAARPSP